MGNVNGRDGEVKLKLNGAPLEENEVENRIEIEENGINRNI